MGGEDGGWRSWEPGMCWAKSDELVAVGYKVQGGVFEGLRVWPGPGRSCASLEQRDLKRETGAQGAADVGALRMGLWETRQYVCLAVM